MADPWVVPLIVAGAGIAGGFAKTLMSGSGAIKPIALAEDQDGATLRRGGFIVNCGTGALAALVSWMLYGTAADQSIFATEVAKFSWANCGAAVLVGLGGSGWLSAELDKAVLRKTAVEAANRDRNPQLAATIAVARPDQALKAVLAAD